MLVQVIEDTYRLFDAFAGYDGSELFLETRTCGCSGSDTCSRCRTEEENEEYHREKSREECEGYDERDYEFDEEE